MLGFNTETFGRINTQKDFYFRTNEAWTIRVTVRQNPALPATPRHRGHLSLLKGSKGSNQNHWTCGPGHRSTVILDRLCHPRL